VVLKGVGTTCTEYLLRSIGMVCFNSYNMANASHAFALDRAATAPLIATLLAAASPSVVPAVRIPLTASSYMGTKTNASAGNMARFPDLAGQYRSLIRDLVLEYTAHGIVTILDLHWMDDDAGPNNGMATLPAVAFWDRVAADFADNTFVFFELYNEPHRVALDAWIHGSAVGGTAGVLQLLAAVRAHGAHPAIIAGAEEYAYGSVSLLQLDRLLPALGQGGENVLYNFHPYMGPHQAGSLDKCPAGFDRLVAAVGETGRPMIITEFGQACCATDGAWCVPPTMHCTAMLRGVCVGATPVGGGDVTVTGTVGCAPPPLPSPV
jgi:hypothetical protein